MLFNSYIFIFCFLPLTLAGFFTIARYDSHDSAKRWLMCASLVFYAWLGKEWIFLLVGSALFNFVLAKNISARKSAAAWLVAGIMANIGLLAYFKYRHEVVFGLNILFDQSFSLPQIILPLALSFFSFHQVAYLVDIYLKRIKPEQQFMEYLLFISFFPHLIAGPILYYREIRPQLLEPRMTQPNLANLKTGCYLFALGLIKKTWLADNIGSWVDCGFGHVDELDRGESFALTYLFGLQLYFDFSAYCDMAIGLARLFNISFPLNFNSPYKANNLQEFWTRWHITLGRFFRDYVYIPLGGNRASFSRQQWNLLVVMVLSGLWHGSNWLFFVWGVWHGVGMIILHLWRKTRISLPKPVGQLLTVNFWVLSLVFFRSAHWDEALSIYRNMIAGADPVWMLRKEHFISDSSPFFWLLTSADMKDMISSLIIFLSLLGGYAICVLCPNAAQLAEKSVLQRYYWFKLGAVLTLGILMITGYTPFIYFQF
jgi:D-alanyl-lipoteichoic acid acyltransferase DltB (MBOAT superfamily)